jgi:ATP-dependent exoDNAse (exonuclease V) alpha subunit
LSVGDIVRVTKNHLSSDGVTLLNNWRLGIESITENELLLTNGAKVDLRRPLHLDQGYAVTSHSSQGQTVDQVLVAAPVRSMDFVSAIMFYVGVSRARYQVQVFTDSRAALLEAVEENLGVRTAAVEAMGEVKPSSGPALPLSSFNCVQPWSDSLSKPTLFSGRGYFPLQVWPIPNTR